VFLITASAFSASETTGDFADWLASLRAEARANGISDATLETALGGLQPIPRVIKLDRNQPEFKQDFRSYINSRVSEKRIKAGRRMLQKHSFLLDKIRQRYGIQPRFLIAIWGLETEYGNYLGGYPVIGALATLAYDPRRSNFFRAELLNALTILDEGHVSISDMQGSWAGAMGQVQFMPSTFVRHAVDADGNGRKDIWHSLPDTFASAANFLADYGWQSGITWGRKVWLPSDFNLNLAGLDKERPLAEWQEMGVRRINGSNLPVVDIKASLILPDGNDGPVFLVYQNYRAILRWNHSHLYALSVCYLADRISAI
jgi:membrane-bound lytic murein transglycosylase B